MKSILILFLLMFSLSAENNITVSKKVMYENSELVAKGGWKLAKEPLTEFVKKDGKAFIKAFLIKAKNPFFPPKIKNGVPKIALARADYFNALSYLKYLENQKQTEESLKIYFEMFKGLHKIDVNEYAILAIIYKITIEKMLTNSLHNSLENNIYSENEKLKIQAFLKKYLILDENLFYKALEADRRIYNNICISQLDSIEINNKMFKSSSFLKVESLNQKELYKKICINLNKKLEHYNKKLSSIKNENEKQALENNMNKQAALFIHKLQMNKTKSHKEINKLRADPNNFIDAISGIVFYATYLQYGELKLKTKERVKENQDLISSFWLTLPPNKNVERDSLP